MRIVPAAIVVASLTLAVEGWAACEGPPQPPGLGTATVLRVIDGSTIQVRLGSRVELVRYLGVVTPPHAQRGRGVHPGGRQAWEFNRSLVERRVVHLEFDEPRRSHDNRLLAYVYVGGTSVNAELICRGYAQVSPLPRSARHHELFLRLEEEAREAGLGQSPRVTAHDGRLVSAAFNATPALEALRAIERTIGIPVNAPASLETQTLTLDVQPLPVEPFLRRVVRALNVGGMAVVYGPAGEVTEVILVQPGREPVRRRARARAR
jgi:micrococcal nuclease